MPASEEQLMEVEALESIYPTEFEMISSDPLAYKVHLVPNPSGSEPNHVGLALVCNIPQDYPNEPPQLDIEIEKGLAKQQREEVLQLANKLAADNLGMEMIFTICEELKQWLSENNMEAQQDSMHAQMMRRMQQQEKQKNTMVQQQQLQAQQQQNQESKAAEAKRRDGTLVTVEVFAAWKVRFDAEMAEQALHLSDGATVFDESKPSGKQLFLTNTAGEETSVSQHRRHHAEGDEDEEEGVEINEDLFEDDEDFDDEEDDEDYEDEDDEDYEDDNDDGEEKKG